jgi:hypothetical protein
VITPLITLLLAWLADGAEGDPPAAPSSEHLEAYPWVDVLYRVLMEAGEARVEGYTLYGPWPLSELIVSEFTVDWLEEDAVGLYVNWIQGTGRMMSGAKAPRSDRTVHGAWASLEAAVQELASRTGLTFLMVGDTATPANARLWRELGHEIIDHDDVYYRTGSAPEEGRIYTIKEIAP